MGGVKETRVRITNFINAKKNLMNVFGIEDDFFIKPALDKTWEITGIDSEYYMLKQWLSEDSVHTSVIVRKDNNPIIVKKHNYTLVVALDCVKVCFIFDNSKYSGKINFS